MSAKWSATGLGVEIELVNGSATSGSLPFYVLLYGCEIVPLLREICDLL